MKGEALLLESMLRDADGVEVLHDSERTWGTLERPTDELGLGPGVRDDARELTVATGLLTLVRDDVYRVDGEDLRLRGSRKIEDGALTVLELSAP